jgi:hypothetical protein
VNITKRLGINKPYDKLDEKHKLIAVFYLGVLVAGLTLSIIGFCITLSLLMKMVIV